MARLLSVNAGLARDSIRATESKRKWDANGMVGSRNGGFPVGERPADSLPICR